MSSNAETAREGERDGRGISNVVASHYNNLEEKGVSARKESRIYHMRNFNNWIKSVNIGTDLFYLNINLLQLLSWLQEKRCEEFVTQKATIMGLLCWTSDAAKEEICLNTKKGISNTLCVQVC